MNYDALFWLLLNVIFLVFNGYYSMMEMACVSFNKVRLQYYISKHDPRALLLNDLLHNSAKLFGTTLIGVNVATMFGSEFAREFHSALGVSPDWAPLSQVIIVIIFGELAPMFAARRYAESIVMLGIRPLYFSAKLMAPLLWGIKHITNLAHKLFGGYDESGNIYLSQEELHKLIGGRDELPSPGSSEELDQILTNIFSLREKFAWQVMTPLFMVPMIPSSCSIMNLRQIMKNTQHPYLPIYDKSLSNIVGIAFARDLIREPDARKVRECARVPWFITQDTGIFHLLKQFKTNNQSLAVVLDGKGLAVGILTLNDLISEIFGKSGFSSKEEASENTSITPLIQKTFPGETKIEEFNRLYNVQLEAHDCETLAELIVKILGHSPEEGDTVSVAPFELTVKEASLLEIKTVTVRTNV